MSGLEFTLAYLMRLEAWALAAVLVQGGLVLGSWLAWERATTRAAASMRHGLACAHFAALVVLPAVTVAMVHATAAGKGLAPVSGATVAALAPVTGSGPGAAGFAAAVGALWLAGVVAMLARLASDAAKVARLDRDAAPRALVDEVRRLAQGGQAPAVRVATVHAPQLIGVWRPVLLAPRSLRDLPEGQRRAVLLHELAHVRRGDFGWNLVQRLTLALLWFHPAAWIIYAHLSRERETACDAFAVRYGAAPSDLARVLVHLAAGSERPGLAMGLASRGELTARVERLLGVQQPAASNRVRLAAVAASVACLLALGAGPLGVADSSIGELYAASAFGPTISIAAQDPAGSFALQVRQGRVLAASVDARPLPATRIRQDGARVVLVGDRREPLLDLTVTPQGRIAWQARSPGPA